MRYNLAALLVASLGFTAHSQVIVFGSGLARDCYEAAKSARLNAVAALDICTKALDNETLSRKDRASTLTNRGILHMRDGNLERAMADYDRALVIDEMRGETYLNKGAAYIYQEQYTEAKTALNKAIELNSDDLYAAYYNRAIAEERMGNISAAYWDFRRALELNPEFKLAERQLERFTLSTDEDEQESSDEGLPA